MLTGDHFVPVTTKGRDQLAKARTVGPNSVGKDDALDWGHSQLLSEIWTVSEGMVRRARCKIAAKDDA